MPKRCETVLQDWHKKGGVPRMASWIGNRGKRRFPHHGWIVRPTRKTTPLTRTSHVYTCSRTSMEKRGPEADTIHTATTDGSPIVGWLLIRYLVLPLSQIYLTHRPAQPTTPLSPVPTAVGVYYAPRPTTADCEWRYAYSRDTAR